MKNIHDSLAKYGFNCYQNQFLALGHGGSKLYGTDNKNSDIDLLGVYLLPKEKQFPPVESFILGYNQPPEIKAIHYIGKDNYDFQLFSLPVFIKSLLNGSPQPIEFLYIQQDLLIESPIFNKIQSVKNEFLSKKTILAFLGFVKRVLFSQNSTAKELHHAFRLCFYLEDLNKSNGLEFIDIERNKDFLLKIKNLERNDNNFALLKKDLEKLYYKLYDLTNSINAFSREPNYEFGKELLIDLFKDLYK